VAFLATSLVVVTKITVKGSKTEMVQWNDLMEKFLKSTKWKKKQKVGYVTFENVKLPCETKATLFLSMNI